MRRIYIILLVILGFLIPIAIAIILVALLNISWWLLWIDLIVEFIIAIILGIVLLVLKLAKKIEIPKELEIKEYKKKAVIELKNDPYNPDNFIINRSVYWQDKSTGKPLALILRGRGSEKNNTRIAIVNLKSLEKEISWISDPQLDNPELETKIDDLVKKITGTYGGEIKEQIITKDVFGNPSVTKTITKPSPEEIKKEEEKESAEAKNVV